MHSLRREGWIGPGGCGVVVRWLNVRYVALSGPTGKPRSRTARDPWWSREMDLIGPRLPQLAFQSAPPGSLAG
jgi:hypothetical protein